MHFRATFSAGPIVLLVLLCCQGTPAQTPVPPCPDLASFSFNLDFLTAFTGLPDSYDAAAGQAGTWVDLPLGTTNGLVNIRGLATDVSMTLTGQEDIHNPQTTLESILLRDSIISEDFAPPFAVFSASLTGLPNGQYDVYYYYHRQISGFTLNGVPMNNLDGGSADTLDSQGTNWDRASVIVTDGTLTIIDTDGGFEGLSGIQIVLRSLPHPSFNLDFDTLFTGLPDSFGASADQTGTWVDLPPGTTNELINTSSLATDASITLTGVADAYHPKTTPEGTLLRDFIINKYWEDPPVAFSVLLTGLPNGHYELFYYSYQATSGLTLNGVPMKDLAGGSADTLGPQGTNWDRESVIVTEGTLSIVDTNGGIEGLSGIQIVALCCDQAIVADLNQDCRVDLVDLSYWAGDWLMCHIKPEVFCWQ